MPLTGIRKSVQCLAIGVQLYSLYMIPKCLHRHKLSNAKRLRLSSTETNIYVNCNVGVIGNKCGLN